MKPDLPRGLEARKALHRFVSELEAALCGRAIENKTWQPPRFPLEALKHVATPKQKADPSGMRYYFENPLVDFNLRIADIATCIREEIKPALRMAGLDNDDVKIWEANAKSAILVRSTPEHPPRGVLSLYVAAEGDGGAYSCYTDEQRSSIERALANAAGPIKRLTQAVDRIQRTVSPQAVLERLSVDRKNKTLTFDGRAYTDLHRNELILFGYARNAAGEFVSSTIIQNAEKKVDFRVNRVGKQLSKRRHALRTLLDIKKGIGTRIVLPLAE